MIRVAVIVLVAILIFLGLFFIDLRKKPAPEKESQKQEVLNTGEKKKQDSDDEKKESWTVWTTDHVNMRKEPNTDSEVVAVLVQNTELNATGEQDGWLKVEYDSKTGYVNAEFVTKEKPKEQVQLVAQYQPSNGARIICIDPGHQRSGDSTQEPNGPNSGTMKARVTGGTHGATSGLYEYELNLMIAQQLKAELQNRGYTVYMTRESHDVNISNKERAEYATSVGASITVRIHANGSENTGVSGALALTPSSHNPYVSHLASASYALSQCVLNSYCATTGLANQGVQANDTMTGINWCTMPVTILEMGYMTNAGDDSNMANPAFQQKMVQGIANGIDAYFAN